MCGPDLSPTVGVVVLVVGAARVTEQGGLELTRQSRQHVAAREPVRARMASFTRQYEPALFCDPSCAKGHESSVHISLQITDIPLIFALHCVIAAMRGNDADVDRQPISDNTVS